MNSPNGPSGWYPDPYGRFEHRYHNGSQWTADVSVGGRRFVDPQWAPGGQTVLTQRMLPVNTRSRAMAVASFIIGIGSVLAAWLPFLFVAGAIGAVLAFVFGILGVRKAATQDGHGRGFAVTGIVLSVLAALLCIVGFMFTRIVLREFNAYNQPGPHEYEVLSCESASTNLFMTVALTNRDSRTRDYVVDVVFESDGVELASDSVAVNGVRPGAVQTFTSNVIVFGDSERPLDCRVTAVHGPAPFDVPPADLGN